MHFVTDRQTDRQKTSHGKCKDKVIQFAYRNNYGTIQPHSNDHDWSQANRPTPL